MYATINNKNSEQQKLLREKELELLKMNELRKQNQNHKIFYHEDRSICSSYILSQKIETVHRSVITK